PPGHERVIKNYGVKILGCLVRYGFDDSIIGTSVGGTSQPLRASFGRPAPGALAGEPAGVFAGVFAGVVTAVNASSSNRDRWARG
ncbi:hypothetical protein O6471_24855, partial [Salmonella enterica subsp. enterica]